MSLVVPPSLRAKLISEAKRRRLAVPGLDLTQGERRRFEPFQKDPIGYVETFLGFTPWRGRSQPGQYELFADIAESVAHQIENHDVSGVKPPCRVFRVEAGHGVGKTFGCAGIVNWFFDCFWPSTIITTAPTSDQVQRLLWKDIKSQRTAAKTRGTDLGGHVQPTAPEMNRAADHFAIGRTTSDGGGQGTSRVQGQHAKFILFILDEAEGVPRFFFDAVNAMMTGGVVMLCIMIANPKTRASEFHRWGRRSGVKNYRFSLLDFPNVLDGKDTIPGGTSREWVESMLAEHCEIVAAQDEAEYTFDLPFDAVFPDGTKLPSGTVFKPDAEFQFRVMGVAPSTSALRSFVASGVYDSAKTREVDATPTDIGECRIGVDVARFGDDRGTIYQRHRATIRRRAALYRQETDDYVEAVRVAARDAARNGATSCHVRIDGTGGFGSGLVDALRKDRDLAALFTDFKVFEVHFASAGSLGGSGKYDNIITECYAEAGETLKGIRLLSPPDELETDLTDRLFGFVNRQGKTLKALESKERFRERHENRSCDDGDGFVLCAAPDFVFAGRPPKQYNPGVF